MKLKQARKLSRKWFTLDLDQLNEVLQCLVDAKGGHHAWLHTNSFLLHHPRTRGHIQMGVHDDWTTGLQPFREITFADCRIFLFESDIESLLS
jgi:hypothetical protein